MQESDAKIPSNLPVQWYRTTKNTGPGIRWRFIDELVPGGTISAVLDDDFILDDDYLARTVAPIEAGWADATGWYGMDSAQGFVNEKHIHERPKRMYILGGGACAMRTDLLRGIQGHRFSNNLIDQSDDAGSSKYLRIRGARLVRPVGSAPLRSMGAQFGLKSIKMTRSIDNSRLALGVRISEMMGLV